jgi:hypothetical protein
MLLETHCRNLRGVGPIDTKTSQKHVKRIAEEQISNFFLFLNRAAEKMLGAKSFICS